MRVQIREHSEAEKHKHRRRHRNTEDLVEARKNSEK